jgi:hypothetical protein
MALAIAMGAAWLHPAPASARKEDQGDKGVRVQVVNNHWLDVRVYAVSQGGAYARIGTVTSFSTARLELPRWATATSSTIRLVAAPIGSSERYSSEPILVSAGETVEWRLANHLALSTLTVSGG